MSINRLYSQSTGNTYLKGFHKDIPKDAVPISEDRYQAVIQNPLPGKERGHDAEGLPFLVDPEPLSVESMCQKIDEASAQCARIVIGDPLRVLEYERAAAGARLFRDQGFPSDAVPEVVSAWAVSGRSPEDAAREIIRQSEEQESRIEQLRTLRLGAKERVRQLTGDQLAAEIATLEAEQAFKEMARSVRA